MNKVWDSWEFYEPTINFACSSMGASTCCNCGVIISSLEDLRMKPGVKGTARARHEE